jgi:HK97 gp10 family phage protein
MANAASADLTALARDLNDASGVGIMAAAQQVIKDTAVKVQSLSQSMAPVKSGRLRNSISIKYPDPLSASIGPQVEYGVYQEFGTGSRGEFGGQPYEIKPKTQGSLLVFKVNGKTVYARRVMHPGIKAHPFMRPALTQALGAMAESMAEKGALLITKGKNA